MNIFDVYRRIKALWSNFKGIFEENVPKQVNILWMIDPIYKKYAPNKFKMISKYFNISISTTPSRTVTFLFNDMVCVSRLVVFYEIVLKVKRFVNISKLLINIERK